ncbi:putative Type IV pilus assembly protein PilP [Candidatus Moduliflexus flocculans]|uniref:Putative Type IV pilus assembly protein PilP n=1 Tax=Candidatus Moduliflexus flocculans TaxID=1499966 RepID=A0A0S6W374_9BACT|nr:putative Type IV pilus assembly protein PilP [Candidatus Moduliflexus flocculans]
MRIFNTHNIAWQKILALMLGMAVMLVFSGCGEQAPLEETAPEKIEKTEPPAPQAAVEEQATAEAVATPTPPGYEYDPTGRREPFDPLIKEVVSKNEDPVLPPNPEEQKMPLQKFEVNQLKITGIVMGSFGDYARVVAPDGKSYTVNVGTLVGTHEGEVSSITDNAVVVREIIRYESGKVEEVETPLYLNPIQEER